MGDTRPDYEEFYQMALDIKEDLDDARILVCPVDHGAYEDSRYMMQPLRDAGVNTVFYRRGPYTLFGRVSEEFEDFWYRNMTGQEMTREDCIEQSTDRVSDEFRRIITSAKEVEGFIKSIGGVDAFIGFDDWADSGISALGVYVFGLVNHARFGIDKNNVKLAASSDNTGGLTHYAARKSVPRFYPSPESYLAAECPNTFKYLERKGLVTPNYAMYIAARPKNPDRYIGSDAALLQSLITLGDLGVSGR